MKVAILGSRSGWHEVRLGRALRERGVEPAVAPITGLAAAVAVGAAGNPLAAGGVRCVADAPRVAHHDQYAWHERAGHRPSACLQSIPSTAHGRASSRSGAIGRLQRSQIP